MSASLPNAAAAAPACAGVGHITVRRLLGALALGAVGAAANCQPVQPFPGIVLALGGIASLYASLALGPVPAMLAAAVAFAPTLYLWDQPLALTVAVAEAAVFGYLYHCRRRGALQSYLLFWGGIGLPAVYLVAFHYAALPVPTRWILLIKYPFNGLLALLVAAVLLRARWLARMTGGTIPPRQERLEQLLVSTYTPVVLAPLLIVAASVGSSVTNRYLQQQHDNLRRAAEVIAGDLSGSLSFLQKAISDAAADIAAQGVENAPIVLQKFHRSYAQFGTMLFASATGEVEYSVGTLQGRSVEQTRGVGFSVADREYFQVPMGTGRVFLSNGFKGRALGSDLIFAISAPVLGREGRPGGVVEASVLLQGPHGGRPSLVRDWSERQFAVIDGNGRVILTNSGESFRPLENLRIRFNLTAHGPGNIQPELVECVLRDGHPPEVVLRSSVPVPGQRWRVVVDLPLREVLRQAAEGYVIAACWMGAAWLLALGVTRVVSAQITRPFRYLAAISRLDDAKLDAGRVPPPPPGMPAELAELGRELIHSRHAISRANADLRAALAERDASNQELRRLSADLEKQVAARTTDLEVARRRAEAASRVKSEFVAHMSHELRTPLNVILGSVRILERERGIVGDPASVARLRQITASGDLLRSLIEDVLDLAKIESGALDLAPVHLDAVRIVQECIGLLEPSASAKRLQLKADLAVADGTMVTDRRRLQQIVLNLLNNAIKFTPAGGTIEVSVRAAAEQRDAFMFAVRDNGIGMAEEELVRLFEPFVRGTAAKASGEPGTGLGLPLVKRIAEHLQGTVHASSQLGVGSCFAVTLPRHAFAVGPESCLPPDPPIPVKSEVEPARPARSSPLVLIAEDHAPNAAILAEICELEGLDTRIAVNGLEAVAMAGEHLPDVILMDWKMPLLEGPEAIQRIKAAPRTAQIPIIALTAYAQPQDAARMAEVGAIAYLTKPIDFDRLLKLFGRLGLLRGAAPASVMAINA